MLLRRMPALVQASPVQRRCRCNRRWSTR